MEKSESSIKRIQTAASKGSVKGKPSKTSKPKARESFESKVSTITEEYTSAAEEAIRDLNTSSRSSITDLFFQSFYSTLILEKKSIKPPEQSYSGSSLRLNYSSSVTLNTSNLSFNESYDTDVAKEEIAEKSRSSQKMSTSESQSTTTGMSSSNPSCESTCGCYWRISFQNGNLYEGQLNESSLMEGKGLFHWSDGSIFKGTFKDGYPCDQGKMILPDLSTYEGQFCTGFFHGSGTLSVKASPLLYCGEWRLSRRNSKGWLLYEADNWYEGQWLNNQKHGIGYRHYSNGDKYKGNWKNDKITGEGCMMWHNNDFYSGEWSEGHQNGYGEYTWNLIAHNTFVFPNYNWYKGNWNNGLRSGAGIMNFGYESGARLAGTWLDNKKHGPGVMICGNGMTLEKNPLFSDDKPAAYSGQPAPSLEVLDHRKSVIQTYASISKQISSKVNLRALDPEHLSSINMSSSNIKMKQYIRLLEKKTGNDPPLKIPIHNVVHEVDLEYFVNYFFRSGGIQKELDNISTIEIENIIKNKQEINQTASYMNYLPSSTDLDTSNIDASASQQCILNTNELTNLIINYLPQLRTIYKTYATLCVDQEVSFEPVLIRMFLWQLYRDIGVTDKNGISIVEVDAMLIKNPNSCLESPHNPWENIYFWQFLQSLVGVACMLYTRQNQLDYTPSSNFVYFMFKDFLDHRLLSFAGIFQERFETRIALEPDNPKVYESLYTFTSLGRKKILACLTKICPQILLPTGRHHLQYRVSFIEFYEAILLMAYEKVEQERLTVLEELKTAHSASDMKTTGPRMMSRMSTHSAKRKKFKK